MKPQEIDSIPMIGQPPCYKWYKGEWKTINDIKATKRLHKIKIIKYIIGCIIIIISLLLLILWK